MYCKYCGKEISDEADVCIHCGRNTDKRVQEYYHSPKSYEIEEPKTAIGFLLGLFFSLIGLLIGLLLYPSETIRRETFVRGWVYGLFCEIVLVIIFAVAIAGCATTYSYR